MLDQSKPFITILVLCLLLALLAYRSLTSINATLPSSSLSVRPTTLHLPGPTKTDPSVGSVGDRTQLASLFKTHNINVSQPLFSSLKDKPLCGRVYVYDSPAVFNMSYLFDCHPRWDETIYSQYMGEIFFVRQVEQLPGRIYNRSQAAILVLPWLFSLSSQAGVCNQSTHIERMNVLYETLWKTRSYHLNQGFDHVLACNDWHLIRDIHWLGRDLTRMLKKVMTATMEPKTNNIWYKVDVGRYCGITMPYVENKYVAQWKWLLPETAPPILSARNISVSFVGSLDPGISDMRRVFPRVAGIPNSVILDVRRSPCTQTAGSSCNTQRLKQAAELAMRSVFCLAPKGDTATTQRIFTAIAAGCIPVVIANAPVLPFEEFINWRQVAIYVFEKEFVDDPRGAVERAINLSPEAIAWLQSNIREVQPHLSWRHPQSRVAHNILLNLCFRCMQAYPNVTDHFYDDNKRFRQRYWEEDEKEILRKKEIYNKVPRRKTTKWYGLHS